MKDERVEMKTWRIFRVILTFLHDYSIKDFGYKRRLEMVPRKFYGNAKRLALILLFLIFMTVPVKALPPCDCNSCREGCGCPAVCPSQANEACSTGYSCGAYTPPYQKGTSTQCAFYTGTTPCGAMNYFCGSSQYYTGTTSCLTSNPAYCTSADRTHSCGGNIECGKCSGIGDTCGTAACGNIYGCSGTSVCDGLGTGASHCKATFGLGAACNCTAQCTSPNICVGNICTALANYAITIVQNAPADSSTLATRTVPYNYTPTWWNSVMKNCSIWDNHTGSFAYLAVNATPLTNNSINTITYAYSSDYSVLKWAAQCCNSTNSCNMTSNYTLMIDSTPPTYYPASFGANNTTPLSGESVMFYSQWTDNINLSKYWFSWNASGANCDTWSNDAPADFQTANWTNTTKTIPNSCLDRTIRYRFYANDTAKNINQTDVKTVTVTPPPLCAGCFNTSATVTIRNPQGIAVNNAPMVCTFKGYILTGTDTPLTCGGISPYDYNNITSSANMSNFSCAYNFPKNYTVEGDWNITVQLGHDSGYNAYDAAIQSPGYDSPDCTGPSTCRTDPQCRSGGGETLNFTLYNISWDARQGDCEGNGDVWFTNVNTSVVPAECTGNPGQACCCGDDGEDDRFYYYNDTSKECRYCNKGVSNLSDESSKKCSDAVCSSGGWNQAPCAALTKKAEPDSSAGAVCFGTNIKFMCNYTDGYGAPIEGALVNVTIDSQVHQINELKFDPSLGYYYNTSTLDAGLHSWNCSASKDGYRRVETGSSDYNISEPSDVIFSIGANPPSPGVYTQPVTFTADYRNASDNTPITDATCILYMRLIPLPEPVQFNGTVYTIETTNLQYGTNEWEFVCNRGCFKTGRNSSTYYVQFPADFQPPSITFEDPAYSINSGTAYHKLVKGAPSAQGLVTRIVSGKSGNVWIYSMVIKPAVEKPTCAQVSNLDKSAILFVKNSSLIANASSCINISQFAGLIFEDDACITNASCAGSLTLVPYLFGLNNSVYSNIPNSTYVLLNGGYKQLQNITKLREFYLNGYYRESKFAPSFLMRLNGQFTPSQYGIESFVKIDQFQAPKTSIDYYYFNGTASPTSYKIKGMPNCENISICGNVGPSHFYMDKEIALVNSTGAYTHLSIYGVERLAIGYTPASSCGDGNCDPTETCGACPPDCKC